MNGVGLVFILLGIIFFFKWVIITSEWKQGADKYEEIKKRYDEIYVKNLEEILAEEERTRAARNIKLAYELAAYLINRLKGLRPFTSAKIISERVKN